MDLRERDRGLTQFEPDFSRTRMAVGGYASEGNPATIARLMEKLQLEF